MKYRLYINDEFVCETLCQYPDWEMYRHPDVKSAYVTDESDELKTVAVYDVARKQFVRVEDKMK